MTHLLFAEASHEALLPMNASRDQVVFRQLFLSPASLASGCLLTFSDIYARQPLYSGTQPSGTALYLLARTIASLGRCSSSVPDLFPVYFSCMYAVFRM